MSELHVIDEDTLTSLPNQATQHEYLKALLAGQLN